MFWDITEPLSYNALINFIVGNRGGGKSYGVKKYAIELFLRTGKQFGYIRRYSEEYKESANTFFNDVSQEFEGHKFEVKGKKFYIDDKVCGHGFILSRSKKKKSMSFPNIDFLIFDEFILDPNDYMQRYLPNEVMTFLDLVETILRMRDNPKIKVFLLANALSFTNPYFLFFNVQKPQNKKKIKCKDDILIQLVENEEFIKAKKKTRFGKLIQGTQYGKYSIENEFLRDNENFIIKQPKKLQYYFTIKAKGENYGVWISYDEGLIYVSQKYDPSCKMIFTTILDNHEPNTMLLKGSNKGVLFKHFSQEFKRGNVYFSSIKVKNIILETFKNSL